MKTLSTGAYVILGMVNKRSMSGYSLKKVMAKVSSFYWSQSNAQIYPVLKQLEDHGLVEATIDLESGARQKRIYTATEKGHEELLKWLEQPCELSAYREEILLHLSMGQYLTDEALRAKLLSYQTAVQEKLDLLAEIKKHINEEHQGRADQRYLMLLYDHVDRVLQAKFDWVTSTLPHFNHKE